MACLLTTTGTPSTVEIRDLGSVFVHPKVSFDLEGSFHKSEINDSTDLRTAISNSEITIVYNGVTIDNTNIANIDHMISMLDLADTPSTLVGQANKVLSVNSGETAIEFSTHAVDSHAIGGVDHTADTLANLNTKVSDATLIDTADSRLSDARTPTSHAIAGTEHSTSTLANLNTKVSDATLIDTGDSRLSDDRNDADAIHDNIASEISVITEKVTPVSGDFLIIEDSAASNAKKRVQVGNLPTGGATTRIQDLCLNDGTSPYIQSTSAAWIAVDSVIYRGSTEAGAITNIKALCHIGGGTSMDIRVQDITNTLTICSKTGITETSETIHDLGTISNVPTGAAIFEIQQQAIGSGAKARCSHMSILY